MMPHPHRLSQIRPVFARLGIALMGLLLGVRSLSAQPVSSIFVRPDERVRVTVRTPTPMGATRVGVLHHVFRDSVTIAFMNGDRETLPLDRLERLEVSDGISGSFVGRGMGYGFLSGAVVGAVIGIAGSDKSNEYVPPVAVATLSGIVGGLAGTVVGGMVGALGRRERWTLVRLEPPLRRVTVTPVLLPAGAGLSRGGVQVGVRF